jgi:flagellar basal-body rod protein FlgF
MLRNKTGVAMNMQLDELKSVLNAQMRKSEVIANNLANIDSSGFKKDVAFIDVLRDQSHPEVCLNLDTDFSAGEMQKTDNPLDLAISGDGFFLIESGNQTAVTRNGHFTIDGEGYLRTSSKDYVLGESGRVNLSLNGWNVQNIKIGRNGDIYADDQYIDRLRIVELDETNNVKKNRNNTFVLPLNNQGEPASNSVVVQGFLEGSNVNAIDEMVSLIEVQRQFESTQKLIRTIDETMQKTANNIGRFR